MRELQEQNRKRPEWALSEDFRDGGLGRTGKEE